MRKYNGDEKSKDLPKGTSKTTKFQLHKSIWRGVMRGIIQKIKSPIKKPHFWAVKGHNVFEKSSPLPNTH